MTGTRNAAATRRPMDRVVMITSGERRGGDRSINPDRRRRSHERVLPWHDVCKDLLLPAIRRTSHAFPVLSLSACAGRGGRYLRRAEPGGGDDQVSRLEAARDAGGGRRSILCPRYAQRLVYRRHGKTLAAPGDRPPDGA